MKNYLCLILLFSFSIGYSQKHHTIIDPINDVNWEIVKFKVRSTNKINFQNQRYKANIELISSNEKDKSNIEMHFILRTNIEEWPVNRKAFIIFNNKKYEIELEDIHSELYYIESATIKTQSDGMITTEISTKDFQLFRKHVDLNTIISPNQSIDNFTLIIYAGNKPIQFKFKKQELKMLENLMVQQ